MSQSKANACQTCQTADMFISRWDWSVVDSTAILMNNINSFLFQCVQRGHVTSKPVEIL